MVAITEPTWAVIEVPPDHAELLPAPLANLPMVSGARLRQTLCLAKISLPPDSIRVKSAGYDLRVAVGAREVWDKFPELRGEFTASILRRTPTGIQEADIPLKYTLAGDVRRGEQLRFYDFHRVDPIPLPPNAACQTIDIPSSQLGRYDFISRQEPYPRASILDTYIYLCDNISIVGTNGDDLVQSLTFLTPEALFNGTDFASVINEKNKPPAHMPAAFAARFQGPKVPGKISGAFAVSFPQGQKQFADALVGRILAAAALSGAAYGKVPMVLRLTRDGWESHGGDLFAGRPYIEREQESYTVAVEDTIFSSVLALLKTTTLERFSKAKEDFRLLALDTIEDSRRSGVRMLEFAQVWMAIERLLPFKSETTAQLALALSAFSPIQQRGEHFKELKRSYGLRSQVVHGYSFSRVTSPFFFTERMAALFRRLFMESLLAKNSEELKELLISHVLNGKPESFRMPIHRPTRAI